MYGVLGLFLNANHYAEAWLGSGLDSGFDGGVHAEQDKDSWVPGLWLDEAVDLIGDDKSVFAFLEEVLEGEALWAVGTGKKS